MPVAAISAGTQAVGGIIKSIIGAGQKRQGRKLKNSLIYPTESVPQEEIENQKLARQQAATGLPSEQYSNAMQNIQRQQLMALRGAHDRRGGLGAISSIQQGTNDATLNLDSADARQKILNQNQLMSVNNRLAGWKDKVWQNNIKDKYTRDYGYAMGLIGAGNQNIMSGIDQTLGGAASGANSLYGSSSSSDGGLNPYTKAVGNIPSSMIF